MLRPYSGVWLEAIPGGKWKLEINPNWHRLSGHIWNKSLYQIEDIDENGDDDENGDFDRNKSLKNYDDDAY